MFRNLRGLPPAGEHEQADQSQVHGNEGHQHKHQPKPAGSQQQM